MMSQLLNNRYRILQPLGSGGFGDTFLAEDTHLPSQRRCVIKKLRPVQQNSQIYQLVKARFQREAVILEDLGNGHPQIPTLYAYFESDNEFYLVQEWIEGESLEQKLQRGGVFSDSAVRSLLTQLLPVLDFIHQHQIVHRDIKPDNIILRASGGQPVLIDFGAVKEAMGTALNAAGKSTSSIVIGTPGFMPQEQAVGRPVFASDLFSLGLTAISLLCGCAPNELTTDPLTGEMVWRDRAPMVSPTLANVLDVAIRAHARDRYPTAQAMLQALQGNAMPETMTAAPPPLFVPQSPQPTMVVAPPSTPSNATPASGFSNFQKMLITGSVVGIFVGGAIALPQLLRETNTVESATVETPSSESPVNPDPPSTPDSPVSPTPDSVPTPLPTSNPTPTPSVEHPPVHVAVEGYYDAVNNQNYEEGWMTLSTTMRNNRNLHPDGFASYTEWWTQVENVNVLNTQIISQDQYSATTQADLSYRMKSGRKFNQVLQYQFVWDADSNRWLMTKVDRLDGG